MSNKEKAGLQSGKNYVNITGKVKITDKSFGGVQKSKNSDWQYVRTNFGVETAEGNVVYVQLMGGYSPSRPIIYAFGKEQGAGMLEINWNDRFNEKVLETVNPFRLHKIGLNRDEQGNTIVKEFLSPIDVEEHLKEHLTDGMEIALSGNLTYQTYNGETQRNIEIQNIYLPFKPKKDEKTGITPEVEYGARFTQTVILSDDSYKKISKADEKEGEVVIPVHVAQYVSKIDGREVKKNMPFAIPIVVKINQDNPEQTKSILDKLFKVKKGKVREITIEGDIAEGYEQEEISSKDIDLSDEIKELIAMGLYSEEEAKQKMTVRGNRVSKLVFTRPYIQRDKEDATKLKMEIDDDKYAPEDLIIMIDEGDNEGTGGDTESEASVEDADWLKQLGI